MENRKIATPIAGFLLAIYIFFNIINVFSTIRYASLSIINIFFHITNIALCVTLFMKRRDIPLLGAIALRVLYHFIVLFMNFGFLFLLQFFAWGGMLLLAYCVIGQNLIQIDLSNLLVYLKKFYYIPAAILGLSTLISIIRNIRYIGIFPSLLSAVCSLLFVAAVFFLAQWLLNPYKKEKPVAAPVNNANSQPATYAVPTLTTEGYANLVTHVVLCLFTFGIWQYIWIYKATKFLNTAPGTEQHDPTSKLLLCLFVPFYSIYWFYKQGQRLDYYCRVKNLPASDMASLCLLLGIFLPIVAVILMQDRFNSICLAK